MITKKKILHHALWGGIFGLISGVITGYLAGAPCFLRLFPGSIEQLLLFLIPGLFLGLALGIADKSIKKIFYGVLGGLAGGLIFYAVVQFADIPSAVMFYGLLFSPMIYIIPICLTFGIMYKSFNKAINGIANDLIVLLATIPLIAAFLIACALVALCCRGNITSYLLMSYTIWGISSTVGIFIGTERGEKKS